MVFLNYFEKLTNIPCGLVTYAISNEKEEIPVLLPLKAVRISAKIKSDLFTSVTVQQVYANCFTTPIDLYYVLPYNSENEEISSVEATVYELKEVKEVNLEDGDEEEDNQEKVRAALTYDRHLKAEVVKARSNQNPHSKKAVPGPSGSKNSVLNFYKVRFGKLTPGSKQIRIRIKYETNLNKVKNTVKFSIPNTIFPRFQLTNPINLKRNEIKLEDSAFFSGYVTFLNKEAIIEKFKTSEEDTLFRTYSKKEDAKLTTTLSRGVEAGEVFEWHLKFKLEEIKKLKTSGGSNAPAVKRLTCFNMFE